MSQESRVELSELEKLPQELLDCIFRNYSLKELNVLRSVRLFTYFLSLLFFEQFSISCSIVPSDAAVILGIIVAEAIRRVPK